MTFCHFLPTTGRPDLTRRAVDSARDHWGRLTILDNCPGGAIAAEAWPVPVVRPTQPLTTPQTLNWCRELAAGEGLDYFLFQHHDAEAGPRSCAGLAGLAGELTVAGRDWAVILTNYDVLAAYRTAACARLGPWDIAYPEPNYHFDLDYLHRARLAGLEVVESGLPVAHLEGGSATIGDEARHLAHAAKLKWNAEYHAAKWGGPPGAEAFASPWGRPGLGPG